MGSPGKRVCGKPYRGFESLPVRHHPTPVRRGGVMAFRGRAENPDERSESGLNDRRVQSKAHGQILVSGPGGAAHLVDAWDRHQSLPVRHHPIPARRDGVMAFQEGRHFLPEPNPSRGFEQPKGPKRLVLRSSRSEGASARTNPSFRPQRGPHFTFPCLPARWSHPP